MEAVWGYDWEVRVCIANSEHVSPRYLGAHNWSWLSTDLKHELK